MLADFLCRFVQISWYFYGVLLRKMQRGVHYTSFTLENFLEDKRQYDGHVAVFLARERKCFGLAGW